MLLDDVSLVQTDTDPTNTTAFRDPVIAALRTYNPGILRSPNKEQAESLDNLIGPLFGKQRSEYNYYTTDTGIENYYAVWMSNTGGRDSLQAEALETFRSVMWRWSKYFNSHQTL